MTRRRAPAVRRSTVDVHETAEAAKALAAASEFLLHRPVEHNVVLSILHDRAAQHRDGRYWWVTVDGVVVAVGLQSPLTYSAGVTPADGAAVAALVECIEPPLPGVIAEAGTAAHFAGEWTQRHRVAGRPREGQRIYALRQPPTVPDVAGTMRPATRDDRALLVDWARGFAADTGHEGDDDPTVAIDRRLDRGGLWLWERDEPVSMADAVPAHGGVVRVGLVYTPPAQRGRGYASACVARLSRTLVEGGSVCTLYTQLENPTSNRIYRAIGYEPVSEVLEYRFD